MKLTAVAAGLLVLGGGLGHALHAQTIEELMNIPQPVAHVPEDFVSADQLMGVEPVGGIVKQQGKGDPADVEVKQVKKHYNVPPAIVEDLLDLPPGSASLSARQPSSHLAAPPRRDTRRLSITAAIGGANPNAAVRRALRSASQLAMHPSGSRVFVSPTLIEGSFDQFGFGVIDTATATLVANIAVPDMRQDSELSDLSVTSDGAVVVVYDNLSGRIDYFDALSYELLVQEPTTAFANRAALSKGP